MTTNRTSAIPSEVADSLEEDYRLHRYQGCHHAAQVIRRLVRDRARLGEALRDAAKHMREYNLETESIIALLAELGE